MRLGALAKSPTQGLAVGSALRRRRETHLVGKPQFASLLPEVPTLRLATTITRQSDVHQESICGIHRMPRRCRQPTGIVVSSPSTSTSSG